MKDFLQGRPSVTPARPAISRLDIPSNLPPISQHTLTLEEPPPPPLEEMPPPPLDETPTDPPTHAHCLEEPRVELVPDSDGRIGHIVLTCRCGEVVTLQCNY